MNNEIHIEFLRLLKDAVRNKALRNVDPTVVYSTLKSSTPFGFF
jgi:hypothetical protein